MTYSKIENISSFNPSEEGLALILTNPHILPPHISFLYKSTIYSLTVKGASIEPYQKFLKMIHQKKISSLFLNLFEGGSISEEHVLNTFNNYGKVGNGDVTCLNPVRDILKLMYGINDSEIHFLFDLLKVLFEKNIVVNTEHLYMNLLLQDKSFLLKTYSRQELHNAIYKLSEKVKIC